MNSIEWDGSQITKGGVYSDVPIDRYHKDPNLFAGPSVSKSALKRIFRPLKGSPKAFWGRWYCNPDHVIDPPSDALNFGKAAHCLILGDESFSANYALRPEVWDSYRKKEAREWKVQVYEQCKTPVTLQDLETIKSIADELKTNPYVQSGILDGEIERTIVAKDPETGIYLRMRPDCIPSEGMYSDFKTAADLSERFLVNQVRDCGYHIQAGTIKKVCQILDLPFKSFSLVYGLKNEVSDSAAVELDPADVDLGMRMVEKGLREIRQGPDTGTWAGHQPFDDGAHFLRMSSWDREKAEEYLSNDDFEHLEAA
ncbi:PD-(D/E)XK nuclease-like domain-containing protein [Flexibacterium corallicola]|uniref:PD-(D/E)XK nuclease-like domain-containing protein n=1 Tax=Flexibacterium corallicola TaxID=3037259 RepID=UPI00286F8E5D|nr:PD-(D/E)XK nuclease-like domain-containing protein [Pseudovibrio sp. M1P-2-3]